MKTRKNKLYRIVLVLILFFVSLGFRSYPNGNNWDISRSDPKLFLDFSEDMVPNDNDVDSDDALYDQTLTHDLVSQSIMDDYNNIASSFITLANKDIDSEYSDSDHSKRIIEIELSSSTPGTSSGWAQQLTEGDQAVGCKIVLNDSILSSAKAFIGTLTHEIGHCLGLDHPQDTTHAIMSYYRSSDIYRLEIDDKTGLTALYPQDPDEGVEGSTLGLKCSPND